MGVRVKERAVEADQADPPSEARPISDPWHRVNTFSYGTRHSPHYMYHGALSQVAAMARPIKPGDETWGLWIERAAALLKAWQASGDDRAAQNLLHKWMHEAITEPAAP